MSEDEAKLYKTPLTIFARHSAFRFNLARDSLSCYISGSIPPLFRVFWKMCLEVTEASSGADRFPNRAHHCFFPKGASTAKYALFPVQYSLLVLRNSCCGRLLGTWYLICQFFCVKTSDWTLPKPFSGFFLRDFHVPTPVFFRQCRDLKPSRPVAVFLTHGSLKMLHLFSSSLHD